MVLQTGGNAVAVAGTLVLFALYLSLTAHLAARNVLGDVPIRTALGVGPAPAIVAVVGVTIGLPPVVTIAVAIAVDVVAIARLYDRPPKLSAYIAFIHAVITILLGLVVSGVAILLASRPG